MSAKKKDGPREVEGFDPKASDTLETRTVATGNEPRKTFLERIPVVGPVWLLYRGYSHRNGALLSAGLAYYGLFAAAPLVLLTMQLAGAIVGPATAKEELSEGLREWLGPLLADMFSNLIVHTRTTDTSTFFWIGAALLFYAAVRLFIRLRVSFNIMWDVQMQSREFSFRRLLSRLAAFALILAPTALFLVSLFLSASATWLQDLLNSPGILFGIVQSVLPFLATWVALITIYTVLPDIRLSWKDTWFGALCAAFACSVGTRVFGAYLIWSGSEKYSGSIGAMIALIVWVDFIAIICLLGVRLNKALYLRKGKVIQPYPFAAVITDKQYQDLPFVHPVAPAAQTSQTAASSRHEGASGE